jgi:hypothetical protein
MESPAFLVLLTVCSCCMSWFLNTTSLYDIVTDREGSDSSAISLLWSRYASKKTVHILTCFWVQANGALSREILLSYQHLTYEEVASDADNVHWGLSGLALFLVILKSLVHTGFIRRRWLTGRGVKHLFTDINMHNFFFYYLE